MGRREGGKWGMRERGGREVEDDTQGREVDKGRGANACPRFSMILLAH